MLTLVVSQHRYWGTDPKKGYAGTAVLSKLEPKNVTYGLPNAGEDVGPTSGRESCHILLSCLRSLWRGP